MDLLASSDALTYQALSAASAPAPYAEPDYDPSEAGEVQRILERSGVKQEPEPDEQYDPITQGVLDEAFGR